MREIATVWLADARRFVRSARAIVFPALYTMVTVVLLLFFGQIASCNQTASEAQIAAGANEESVHSLVDASRKGVIAALFSDDRALLEALASVPLVALLIFRLSLFALPAFAALMGFDQISGELGPRSIRYLTIRARRSSILLGKFLAQATVLLTLALLVDAGLYLYAKVTTPDFTTAQMVFALLKAGLAAILFSLAYVALTTLCSTLFRTPAIGLIVNLMLWMMDFFLWLLQDKVHWSLIPDFLRFLRPSYYATNLLHPELTQFGISAGAYLGFTALFLAAAILVLRRRDL